MSNIQKQIERVREWAECINLYPETTPLKQLEKFGEEFLEFVGHSAQFDMCSDPESLEKTRELIKDDIGDMCVCLVNVLLCAGWNDYDVAVCFGEPESSKGSLKKDIEATHSYYFTCIDCRKPIFCQYLFDYVEMLASRYDINVAEALEGAVDVIWERRHSGKMRDGKFVKAEDL